MIRVITYDSPVAELQVLLASSDFREEKRQFPQLYAPAQNNLRKS